MFWKNIYGTWPNKWCVLTDYRRWAMCTIYRLNRSKEEPSSIQVTIVPCPTHTQGCSGLFFLLTVLPCGTFYRNLSALTWNIWDYMGMLVPTDFPGTNVTSQEIVCFHHQVQVFPIDLPFSTTSETITNPAIGHYKGGGSGPTFLSGWITEPR